MGKLYDLTFGMYFLSTLFTRKRCNRLGRTPICRDSRVNDMFHNTFPLQLNNTPKPWRTGVRCRTSDLVCTSCTLGVQEKAAIGLVVLQSADIPVLIICFAIHFLRVQLNNTPKPWRPGVRCTTSALVYTSCTLSVQENAIIGLVVLQSAEILGLIICFAIHFLCVTIE